MTRPPMTPAPKPQPDVKRPRKPLRARRGVKAFAHRRIPAYVEFIQSFACLLRGRDGLFSCPLGIFGSECAHVRSRGAGGDDLDNCVPLCTYHHQQQHLLGRTSFEQRYGLDLAFIARDLGKLYRARVAATEAR